MLFPPRTYIQACVLAIRVRTISNALQAKYDSLEEELDGTYQELECIQRQEALAQRDLLEAKEQLATVQTRLQDTTRLWLSPEMAGTLRLEAEEWQAKHDKIEHRYSSLLDDFQHLSDRMGTVEAERRRQHEHRRRIAGLHAGLEQVQIGMLELQQRCCDVWTFSCSESVQICHASPHAHATCILSSPYSNAWVSLMLRG